jgi:hypothetical protein
VQELGKGPQRCRVLRTWREPDGMVVFEVQSISTGARMTIVESGAVSARAGSQPGSKLETMTTRIYHWSGANRPPGAPLPPANAVAIAPPATPASPTIVTPATPGQSSWPTANNTVMPLKPVPAATLTSDGKAQPAPVATAQVQIAQQSSSATFGSSSKPLDGDRPKVEPAQPTDWHRSWGKPVVSQTKPVPVTELPHADTTRPDPLADPMTYTSKQPAGEPVADATPAPRPVDTLPNVTQPAPTAAPKATVIAQQPKLAPVPTTPAPTMSAPVVKSSDPKLTPVPTNNSTPCTTSTPCSPCTPCVACCETPKRRFLFWTFDSCKECKQDNCVCQPAPCARAPCNSEPKPVVVAQPVEHKPTFVEKFQAGLAQSQTQRQARAETTVAQPVPPKELMTGSKSVVAAADGAPGAQMPMPVPIIMIPPVRNPQALRPAKPKAPPVQEAQPAIPRSEIENAFTEIEPAKGGRKSQAQPATESEDVNAFSTPPENIPDGELPRNMYRSMQQTLGVYPGPGYAPSGMGMYPYGFNPAVGYSSRPQMGMMPGAPMAMARPQMGMMPGAPMAMARPQMGMMPGAPMAMARPQMMMVPGPVYVSDTTDRPPVSEARAAERSTPEPNVDIPHLLTLLKSALYPSHREWAADNLAVLDGHKHPQVVEALLKAAKEDPAATVRTGCIRGLGTMHANNPAVLAALEHLKSDASPQVSQEANRVLAQLAGTKVSKQ